MDFVTHGRILALHPSIRQDVERGVNFVESKGVRIRIVQGFRTFDEQNNLYAQGRTTAGKIVTNAKGGESYHNYGLAFDFCLLHLDKTISWSLTEDFDSDGQKDWMEVVEHFMLRGFQWGGNWKFKDYPHLERNFGYTVKRLKEMYDAKEFDNDGYLKL